MTTDGHAGHKPLTLKVKVGYGVCDVGGNLYFTAIAFVLLNFLTDTVGIDAAKAGTIIMIGKIWDAITDPAVGYFSDRTKSRWGKRRPYILFGSVPLFLAMIAMFTHPGLTDQTHLMIWAGIVFCALGTAYTLVNIPYSALTPELTPDFHERTVLNGYRMSFAVCGSLLGAGAAIPIAHSFEDRTTGYSVMGFVFGLIMMITALVTFFTVKEPKRTKIEPQPNIFVAYFRALTNKPFLFVLLAWIFHTLGITVLAGNMMYYFKYVFKNEGLTPIALVVLLVTAMVCIPLWVKISKTKGKKACSIAGMLIISAALVPVFLFGHVGGLTVFLPLMIVAGFGLSTQYVFPYATIPDVVEYDYANTGKRKEGIYYGLWNFSIKIGQALAVFMMGHILDFYNYIPDQEQTEEAKFGIRLLFGPVPIAFYLLGAISLYFYPLTKKRYEEIMERIRQRDQASAD